MQTLFYGVFLGLGAVVTADAVRRVARIQLARRPSGTLRAPVLRALFQQLSDPGRLQPLGLVEVLNWTATALNRVERDAFFATLQRGAGGASISTSHSCKPSTRR